MRARIAASQHEDCSRAADAMASERSAFARARVSNHHDLLPGIDGRSLAGRRFRDLVFAFMADLGGAAECSSIKINLIRRLAATTVQSELLESRMALGQPVDVATLCQLASTAVRISARLGLERRAKDLTPTLDDIRRDLDEARQRAPEGEETTYDGEEADYDVAEADE